MSLTATRARTTQAMLDALPPRSVVIDRFGHAWQGAARYNLGGSYPTGYWYRAYDGNDSSETSTHEITALGPFKVVWKGART